jgi:hypothetical protein
VTPAGRGKQERGVRQCKKAGYDAAEAPAGSTAEPASFVKAFSLAAATGWARPTNPTHPSCRVALSLQSTAGVDAAKTGRLPAALTRRYDVYFVPEEHIPASEGEAPGWSGGTGED